MADVMRIPQDTPVRHLLVGTPLQLAIPFAKTDVHCQVLLLGWKEGVYLITELPTRDDEPLEVSPGMPCMVRYTFAGKMVGYRGEVRASQLTPEALLFLTFPTRIEHLVLRKHPRVPLRLGASVRPIEQGGLARGKPASAAGLLQDLGPAGCRVEFTGVGPMLCEGNVVLLDFELPGLGRVTNLTGVVKHLRSEPTRVLAGIEFLFHRTEYIEFRGWGGTVRKAIERFVAQRHAPWNVGEDI